MNILVVALRLIHIGSAIFWSGGALLMTFFIGPSVFATADAGQRFLAHLVTKARITNAITVSAILTVLAGVSLYWKDSGGLTSEWMTSSAGIGFGIGGLAGLTAFVFGALFGRNIGALGKILSEVQGKPTPEQIAQIQAIGKRNAIISPIHVTVQIIAIICMATARYWFVFIK